MGRQTVGDIHNLNTFSFKVGLGRKVHFFPLWKSPLYSQSFSEFNVQQYLSKTTISVPRFCRALELALWYSSSPHTGSGASAIILTCFDTWWALLQLVLSFLNNSHFTFCPFIHSPLSSSSLLMIGLTFK